MMDGHSTPVRPEIVSRVEQHSQSDDTKRQFLGLQTSRVNFLTPVNRCCSGGSQTSEECRLLLRHTLQ